VLGVRVTKGFARELSKACSAAGCTQSDMLRLGLAKLSKSSSDDPDAQLALVRDALGLEGDADREMINAALDAAFAIVGDAEPQDPMAASANTPPADPMAQPGTDKAVAASKALSSAQIEALTRRGLPLTNRAWLELGKSVLRSARDEPPARAASTSSAVTLSKAQVQAEIAKLSKDKLDAIKARGMTPEQFIAARAGVLRKAQ